VYYEDTDAGGIVYHANYLKFAERGRTEMLRATGHDHQSVMAQFNIILIVRHIEIDYNAPAKLDDLLTITTSVSAVGNTSLTMTQVITRDANQLAVLKVIVVAVTPDGKPTRLPSQLRQSFGVN
jgi:acyl-CoA thioester hydrolase